MRRQKHKLLAVKQRLSKLSFSLLYQISIKLCKSDLPYPPMCSAGKKERLPYEMVAGGYGSNFGDVN